MENELAEKLEMVRRLSGQVDVCKGAVQRAQEVKKEFESELELAKQEAYNMLYALGAREFNTPEVTIRLKKKPVSLASVDATLIPQKYLIEQEPKIDRRSILADLKAGEEIEGAALTNGGETVEFKFRELG